MSLNLDARQRAMLQDMGITVWAPRPVAPAAESVAPSSVATATAVVDAPAHTPASSALQRPASAAPVTPPPVTTPAPAVKVPASTSAAEAEKPTPSANTQPVYRTPAAMAAPWWMAPVVPAFGEVTQADPAMQDDAGWLVVVECEDPLQPLAGEAGILLGNMLRALRLQNHPRVRIAALTRQAPAESYSALQPLAPALQAAMAEHRPARVLLMGLHAARAVLQRSEALGRLRAEVHTLHGTHALVTYDPAYLLRAPHAKPGAWADLCRAHALQPPQA